MDPRLATVLVMVLQGVLGVGGIVLAVVFLGAPQYQVAYTTVVTFCGAMLGNLKAGPNQVSVAESDRRVARATSDPPSRP